MFFHMLVSALYRCMACYYNLIHLVYRKDLDDSVVFEQPLEMSSKDTTTLVTEDFNHH